MQTAQEMKDFMQLVKRMRDAQKAYFKNRTQSNLSDAKSLERQVDGELFTRLSDVKPQPSLFNL